MSSKYGIYRYGYHGLSVSSAVVKFKARPGGIPDRVIVCHLGSGASVTAIKKGESVDTSMGFTPLEGVPMGSRVGNIDAEAVLFIQKAAKLTPGKLSHYLNTESGLRGLSGGVSDIRELLYMKEKGDKKAILALHMFTYRIKQCIGSYMAVLGGIDSLVFTGTIGERSPKIREQICEGLEGLGIAVDYDKNELHTGEKEGNIQNVFSKAGVVVLRADEMKIMACETDLCIKRTRVN
jgi:acetate kinase